MSSKPCNHTVFGGGDHDTLGLCGWIAAQFKVRVCGLGLLSPRLNSSPVCV